MNHKGADLERQAKRLDDEANSTIDTKRRQELRKLAADLKRQARDWYRPK